MTPAHTPPDPAPTTSLSAGHPTPVLEIALAAGWSLTRDEKQDVALTAPDGFATVHYSPAVVRDTGERDRLWTAAYHRAPTRRGHGATWGAVFGEGVPVAAVAAFTAALTDPAGARRHHRPVTPVYTAGPGEPGIVCDAAAGAGWIAGRGQQATVYTSPGAALSLTYDTRTLERPGAFSVKGPHWCVSHTDPDAPGREWSARFSSLVPAEAIAAFALALTN